MLSDMLYYISNILYQLSLKTQKELVVKYEICV